MTCVLLAILSYRSVEIPRSSARSGSLKNVDYLGAVLMTAAVVPLLAGLSLAGTLYAWNDWRPLLAVAFGSLCLLLFIGREICYPATWAAWPKTQGDLRPLLGFKSLDGVQSAVIFGSFTLGLLVSRTETRSLRKLGLTCHRYMHLCSFSQHTSASSSTTRRCALPAWYSRKPRCFRQAPS